MYGYTVHTGSSDKFTKGWDQIFGGGQKKKAGPTQSKTPPTGKKKSKKSS